MTTPFAEDFEHASYDRDAVERFWHALRWIDWTLQEFAGWFCGKTSPVHLFWHGFDLAVTRFSGARAPETPTADPVTREAYSHEVISFGFWPGDQKVRGASLLLVHGAQARRPRRPAAPARDGELAAAVRHRAISRFSPMTRCEPRTTRVRPCSIFSRAHTMRAPCSPAGTETVSDRPGAPYPPYERGDWEVEAEMDEPQIHGSIERLVAEEHELWERESAGDASEADRARLEEMRRPWLRQMLGTSSASAERLATPARIRKEARARRPEVVKRYQQ